MLCGPGVRRPFDFLEREVSTGQTSTSEPKMAFRKSEFLAHCSCRILCGTAPHGGSQYGDNMINKIWADALSAVSDIPDGAVVGIGGFGNSGVPTELIDALIEHGARHLTVVSNNAGGGEEGLARLLQAGLVRKIVCSFPRAPDSYVFDGLYRSGQLQLELVPQGTLAERLRAAGAGVGGFFTPTAYGTALAEGRETRVLDGRHQVFETALKLDYALVKAERADRWGNLVYRKLARNFGPVMATAAQCTIASVAEVVPLGDLDPETIVTPSVYVKRIVQRSAPSTEKANA